MAFTSACSVGMWAAIPDCLVFFLCLSAWHIEEAFGSRFLGSPASELSPAKKPQIKNHITIRTSLPFSPVVSRVLFRSLSGLQPENSPLGMELCGHCNGEHSFLLSKNRRVVGREQSWQCNWCIWLPDVCLIKIQTPTPDSVWTLRKILTECCRVAISEGTAFRWKSRCPRT